MAEQHLVLPDELFKLKFLQGAKLSPDGKFVVYCLSGVDAAKNEETSALWLLDLENQQSRQLTAGKDLNPEWSPDSKLIAFLSAREGAPQVYLIPVDGGEARALTSMKQPIGGGPVWSPDGKSIAFTAGPKTDPPPDPTKPYRVTRPVYRFDGAGLLQNVHQDIYIIASEGGEPKQLTSDAFQNMGPLWSSDGQEILYTAAFNPDSLETYAFELRLVNLRGEVKTILKDYGIIMMKGWSHDGAHVLFGASAPGSILLSKLDLWVIPRDGGKTQCKTASHPLGLGMPMQGDVPESASLDSPIFLSPDGTKAYVPVQDGGTLHVLEVAIQGEESCKQLTTGDRCVLIQNVQNERMLLSTNDLFKPSDLVLLNLKTKEETRLTHINDEILAAWEKPVVEHLLFSGAEGVPVEGWVMKPPRGEPPFPTILYIHGGPQGAFGHTFSFDFQMLAGAGYVVLFTNPHGSTGYGNEFIRSIDCDWGNLDYRDQMAAVDYVIEKGLADPDRLGVCGLSYGGYMTTWIIGHTDRFKAAVPENPVTDLVSMYGTSDIGAYMSTQVMGGKPHEVPETYRKCSPITYAHRCTTPTLLIQGEIDFRCPAGQSEQFYTTLKANGCIVEMLRCPGGSHGGAIIGPVAVRKAQNDALLDWMNRYVRGQSG